MPGLGIASCGGHGGELRTARKRAGFYLQSLNSLHRFYLQHIILYVA